MRHLQVTIFVPALLSCLLYSNGVAAQSSQLKNKVSLVQAESLAVDLKQGMTLEEVEKLLGKPKRTALKASAYGATPDSSQGILQWTYTWSSATQSDHSLQVMFASKSPERWIVNSWDWAGY
jgi:hypothetical protein